MIFSTHTHSPAWRAFMRANRRPSQIAMLLGAAMAGVGGMFAFSQFVNSAPGYVIMIVFRWCVGEFLWCWMAADHCFSTIGFMQRTGRIRDWRLTRMRNREITDALIWTTTLFVGVGVAFWLIADLALPWNAHFIAAKGDGIALYVLWRFAFPVAMFVSHLATGYLAAAFCTRRALMPGPPMTLNWLYALIALGQGMLMMMMTVLFGWIVVGGTMGVGKQGFVALALIVPLYEPAGVIALMGILLAVTLPAKIVWGRWAARSAPALLEDERNLEVKS